MPATHDDAICLRHREWSETSQTVTLLTREHGLVHGLAKGSYREKAPFSGGFEHLQLGELGFINKPDRDLVTLTEWDLIDPFPVLRTDFRAATIAMLAAELAASLLGPFDPHPDVFEGLLRLLRDIAQPDPITALPRFLLDLLEDTGHAVNAPEITDGTPHRSDDVWAFDPETGLFTPDPDRARAASDPFSPDAHRGVWHLRGETLDALRELGHAGTAQKPENQKPKNPTATRLAWFLTACAVYRSSRRPNALDAFRRATGFGGASGGSP